MKSGDNLHSLPTIKEVITKYSINADKKLGQNFLFDLNLTDKIARSAGNLQGKTVIEIGPGPGGLTRSLLAMGAEKVIAIEKDYRCIAALNDYLAPAFPGRLEIIEDDAMKSDVYDKFTSNTKIVANLPYNIATELLFIWLSKARNFESMTLMFQREVAMRIMAKPRTKDYGRVSVKAQWLCDVDHQFDIPPQAFYPPPKVTSTVITITPRKEPLVELSESKLDVLLRAAFNQRRKMLKVSLKQILDDPYTILDKAGIDGTRRPEELSVIELCNLAKCLD